MRKEWISFDKTYIKSSGNRMIQRTQTQFKQMALNMLNYPSTVYWACVILSVLVVVRMKNEIPACFDWTEIMERKINANTGHNSTIAAIEIWTTVWWSQDAVERQMPLIILPVLMRLGFAEMAKILVHSNKRNGQEIFAV